MLPPGQPVVHDHAEEFRVGLELDRLAFQVDCCLVWLLGFAEDDSFGLLCGKVKAPSLGPFLDPTHRLLDLFGSLFQAPSRFPDGAVVCEDGFFNSIVELWEIIYCNEEQDRADHGALWSSVLQLVGLRQVAFHLHLECSI